MSAKDLIIYILILAMAGTLSAQEPPAASTNTPASAGVSETQSLSTPTPAASPVPPLVLREGTEVKLKFAQDLSSKTCAEDDPVTLVLDEGLKIGDVMVAEPGAKATGRVTHVKKAGMLGKAGELNIRLEYMLVNNQRMRLRGSKGKEGEGKEGTAVALTVLFGPIGLIKHGKNVEVKQGTPLLAYVDQDFVVPGE